MFLSRAASGPACRSSVLAARAEGQSDSDRPARLDENGRPRIVSGSAAARIVGTGWKTSLFPKDGRYIVPVKAGVRRAEGLEVGDMVTVRLIVDS